MWFFPLLAIFRVSLKYLVLGIWSFDLYDFKKRSTVMESLSSIFKKGRKESLSKNKWFARRNAFFVVFVKIDCDRIDPVDLWKRLTVIELILSNFKKERPLANQSRQCFVKIDFLSSSRYNFDLWINCSLCLYQKKRRKFGYFFEISS